MSTIKVNKIENTGTTDGGVEIDSSGHVQVDGLQMPTVGPLSNRNLIINGAMQVAQRSTSAVQIGTGTYSLDRFRAYDNTSGTFTVQQVTDAPAGFKNSAKVTVTTAASSIGVLSQAKFQQRIEGNVITQLGLGTSGAKTFTLSFYVKSSVTGTYAIGFINASNNRSYVATYSISSANTWEYKTITVQGDTSGTWATDNTIGLNIQWSLGIGSTYQATAGQWHASEESHTSGAVNLISTLNATWQITGIQLEVGEKATPFEHRSYGDELARCQRYFETSYPPTTSPGSVFNEAPTSRNTTTNIFRDWQDFKVTKRATPTVRFYSSNSGTIDKFYNASTVSDISIVADNHSVNGARVSANASSDGNLIRWNFTADAEL